MGLFGHRKSREERAHEIADKVASGKGFYGRATRAIVGGEDFARLQESVGAYNTGLTAQQLIAMGVPPVPAVVVSITDTGKLVNFDPVVELVVDLVPQPSGVAGRIELQTIVSKLRIPRAGEQVLMVADPAQPGVYLYAGVS
ncbi:hypothetical protein [Streptomyces sp. BE147]|uniref:hypothetical protein n=1 Tax=unclassified Streptomyces TaxID=2593676 RepID=UPI002E78E401|nr:hypothetical protein [Streptomyces sp. BE147]MEE1740314.1 hypothetical protein [Streptomyces sp. BE147]